MSRLFNSVLPQKVYGIWAGHKEVGEVIADDVHEAEGKRRWPSAGAAIFKGMQTLEFKEMETVRQTVADYFGIAVSNLNLRCRKEPLVTIRHVAMLLCVELTGASRPTIGTMFHRDHSNVTHSVLSLKRILETDTHWALNFLQCSLLCKRALGRVAAAGNAGSSQGAVEPLVPELLVERQRTTLKLAGQCA